MSEPVDRYLAHALGDLHAHTDRIRLQMCGRIRVGIWMNFEAEWEGDGRSFSWLASAGPGRLRPLRVHDQFADGTGSIDVRVKPGLRLLHAENQDVARSGAGRAALEAIWAPASLRPSDDLVWSVEGEDLIVARRSLPPEETELRIEIDPEGRVLSCHGPRWRSAKHGYQPCGALVHEERHFGGLTIPSKLSVGWGFGTDDWASFFECEVLAAELVA